jgi:hypothetical protein
MDHWGTRLGRAALALALWPGGLVAAQAADDDAPAVAASAPPVSEAAARHAPRLTIASRVQLLTRELGLDVGQQSRVQSILQDQRSEVSKVWSDSSISSALRVRATQAIGDKTADRIRAILNEAQRKKYIQPRMHEAPVGAPGGDVQQWLKTAQGLEQPAKGVTSTTGKEN